MALGASQVVSGACPAAYGARLFHPDRHLCTLDPTPTRAQACAGDSGGPVMVRRNGAWALAAVVTWGGETQGRDCGEGLPDVSERVDAHGALLTATGSGRPVGRAARARPPHGRRAPLRDRALAPGERALQVRWWKGDRVPLQGGGKTRRVRPAASAARSPRAPPAAGRSSTPTTGCDFQHVNDSPVFVLLSAISGTTTPTVRTQPAATASGPATGCRRRVPATAASPAAPRTRPRTQLRR